MFVKRIKKQREMVKPMLACCKVYISEGRNRAALESIDEAAKLFPGAYVINKFQDEVYNRVVYTIVSKLAQNNYPSSLDSVPLRRTVVAMVEAAFETIDLESHCGTHPRTGVVDYICFHPLAQSSLDQAAWLAKSVAADIASSFLVPTFLCGAAHEEGRTVDSIRRELGYFKPNSEGNQWVGGPESELLPLNPDKGPSRAARAKGVLVVGATQWIDNYNVPIFSTDIAAVRRITKCVRGRGGGLPSVQALTLAHGEDIIEVACSLLEPSRVGADQVQREVERLAGEERITVGMGYFTDFSQEKVIENYLTFDSLK